jgi:hypothetical protein
MDLSPDLVCANFCTQRAIWRQTAHSSSNNTIEFVCFCVSTNWPLSRLVWLALIMFFDGKEIGRVEGPSPVVSTLLSVGGALHLVPICKFPGSDLLILLFQLSTLAAYDALLLSKSAHLYCASRMYPLN